MLVGHDSLASNTLKHPLEATYPSEYRVWSPVRSRPGFEKGP